MVDVYKVTLGVIIIIAYILFAEWFRNLFVYNTIQVFKAKMRNKSEDKRMREVDET